MQFSETYRATEFATLNIHLRFWVGKRLVGSKVRRTSYHGMYYVLIFSETSKQLACLLKFNSLMECDSKRNTRGV